MFGKSWKRPVLSLGILFLIVISGLCYLSFDSRRKSKEPVKIYRVTEPAKKDASSDATTVPSVKNDTQRHPNSQKGVETAQTDPSTTSVSIPSVDPNTPSGESDQQGSDLKTAQQNNERLAKEKAEQERARIQAKIRAVKASLSEQQNALEEVKKKYSVVEEDINQRNYTLAERLNSLSAEEQRAYFEEEYLSGKAAAEQFISAFFERLKSKAASRNYSEHAEKLIEQMKQGMPKISDAERINQHIEKLREYGFKPKF